MFKVEMFKMIRKRETKIIFCLLALPILFSVLFANVPAFVVDYPFGDKIPQLPFAVTVFGFFSTLGVFGLVFSILATSTLSSEISSHHTLLFFPRLASKKKLFSSKLYVLLVVVLIWFALFIVSSMVGYILTQNSDKAVYAKTFTDESTIYWVLNAVCFLFELFFIVGVVLLLGLYLNNMVSILVSLAIVYGSVLFSEVPVLCYALPSYYKKMAMDCVDLNNTSSLIGYTLGCVAVSLVYLLISQVVGRKKISMVES